jgi:ubiquinone/menaquinone biosynthesis C-methylase UbiE
MIREARVRCAHLPNVALRQISGHDLASFPDRHFDAVIAVDSLPYLYQAGGPELALALLGEAARVLRPRGDLVVLNLSYRGDLERDRADAAAFADALGLELVRNGSADLALWDGRTFHFRRP